METVNLLINGKAEDISINGDLNWGQVQKLLRVSMKPDSKGNVGFDFITFCDQLLEVAITKFPFEVTNRTKLQSLPMGEMSKILGEVLKRVPLEDWFKELGLDENSIAKTIKV